MELDLNSTLKFLVCGAAPNRRIYAAFLIEGDANQYAKPIPFSKVMTLEEYVDEANRRELRASSR